MRTFNQRRLASLKAACKALKTKEFTNLDYTRYEILNAHGSLYIKPYSGWVRVTASGVKAKQLCELVLGPTKERDNKSYPTWQLA